MNHSVFAVLSEPNRFQIIELLRVRPATVNQIVESLKLHQPQVSKHLKVLADAGVVAVHPSKNKRVYALKKERFQELDEWLQRYKEQWNMRFDRLETLLKREGRG